MKLSDLTPSTLRDRLAHQGVLLRTGPVVSRVRTSLDAVANGIALHYAAHPVEADGAFADFDVCVSRPQGLRRWWKPQVVFRVDSAEPFAPLPGDQGFPMLEWGLNWCVSTHCHQYLMLHAAVVERDGRALILPGPPGAGKSTLCAGLIHRGWRLLSDELTLIEPATLDIVPIPRPVSLKNASVDVIRDFAPAAAFSPLVRETNKGSVAHLRPPASAIEFAGLPAVPGWIVLPRWLADSPARLEPLSKGQCTMKLIDNAFNYNVHGAAGFRALCGLVDRSDCFEFTYSSLDDAARCLGALAAPTN